MNQKRVRMIKTAAANSEDGSFKFNTCTLESVIENYLKPHDGLQVEEEK